MDTDRHYRILLIDHDSIDTDKVRGALAGAMAPRYSIESLGRLSDGIARVKEGELDGVLRDLCLPDGCGLATFERLWEVAPDVPILIVCRPEDESLAMQCVERGAQD